MEYRADNEVSLRSSGINIQTTPKEFKNTADVESHSNMESNEVRLTDSEPSIGPDVSP